MPKNIGFGLIDHLQLETKFITRYELLLFITGYCCYRFSYYYKRHTGQSVSTEESEAIINRTFNSLY